MTKPLLLVWASVITVVALVIDEPVLAVVGAFCGGVTFAVWMLEDRKR